MEIDRDFFVDFHDRPDGPCAGPRGPPPGRRLHDGDLPMISVPFAHVGGIPIEDSRVFGPALLVGFGLAWAKPRARLLPGAHSRQRARPASSAKTAAAAGEGVPRPARRFGRCARCAGSTRLEPDVDSPRRRPPGGAAFPRSRSAPAGAGGCGPGPNRIAGSASEEGSGGRSYLRARVHPGKEDEFERFVIETGVPMVKAQEGCTHVTVGKSRWSEQPEFLVVTHWRSVDALQAFAGPDWQKRGDRARGGAHAGPGLLRSLRNDGHGLSRQRMAA